MITKEQLDRLIDLARHQNQKRTLTFRDELLKSQEPKEPCDSEWYTFPHEKPDSFAPLFNAILGTDPSPPASLLDRSEDITNDCYETAHYDNDFLKRVQEIITAQAKLMEDLIKAGGY